MSTHNIPLLYRKNDFPKLSPFAMINPKIERFRAIAVLLYNAL